MADVVHAVLARDEIQGLDPDVAIGGHDRIARARWRPAIVDGIGRQDRDADPSEGAGDLLHAVVVQEVPRMPAPVLPLAVEAQGQVLAHAEQAPPQIATGPGDDRAQAVPQRKDLQLLQSWHPAVPAGAGAEGDEAVDPPGGRHDPERMAGIGVSDDEQCPVRVAHAGQCRRQVQASPVEIVKLELAQVSGP